MKAQTVCAKWLCLCCTSFHWAAASLETIRSSSQHLSLCTLQVATQFTRGGMASVQREDVHNGVRRELAQPDASPVSNASLATVPHTGLHDGVYNRVRHKTSQHSASPSSVNMSLAAVPHAKTAAKNPLGTYLFFAHHKSGSLMTLEAVRQMNTSLGDLSGLSVDFSRLLGQAVWPSEMLFNEPRCLLHVVRNPFELVVSGYLYHMAESEDWLRTHTFRRALYYVRKNRVRDGCTPKVGWMCLVLRGLAQVYRMSRAGPTARLLPTAQDNETFSQYLQRVEAKSGLLAEAIFSSNYSLASMRFTSDVVSSRPCSMNVCFEQFYDDCNAVWKRVLQAWNIKDPHYSKMLRGAMKSCPDKSKGAKSHSSSRAMHHKHLSHAPEHVLLHSLRELDSDVLNGMLASLETHIGSSGQPCKLSGKYAGPGD